MCRLVLQQTLLLKIVKQTQLESPGLMRHTEMGLMNYADSRYFSPDLEWLPNLRMQEKHKHPTVDLGYYNEPLSRLQVIRNYDNIENYIYRVIDNHRTLITLTTIQLRGHIH
jgi:hypothetical protein